MKILVILEREGEMRYFEIVDALWKDSETRKLSRGKPAFKVLVSKRLQRLKNEGDVDKKVMGHKNVSYFLTKQGQETTHRLYLEELIFSMPPVEVQALQFMMYVFITCIQIIAPRGASLEDYIRLLRDRLNRDDIIELARAVMKDPKKSYAELSEYLSKYKAEELVC